MTLAASCAIEDALNATGLRDVRREERNSYYQRDMDGLTPVWMVPSLEVLIFRTLMWPREVETVTEARGMAKGYLEGLNWEYEAGSIPNFPHRVVIRRWQC
jgi:hypothetical protein